MTAVLSRDKSDDVTMQFVSVSDADGDAFTCSTDTAGQTLPFGTTMGPTAGGYVLTCFHTDPVPLTANQYVIQIQCTDVNASSATANVTIAIRSNSPPVPKSSLVETVTVNVSKSYLPLTVLTTVEATDPDGDPITCTASPPAGFMVDPNDCTIRNRVDLRSLGLTPSEVIHINVSDGINPAVQFQRTLSFINPHRPPVFAPLPSIIQVHENYKSADTIVTFDVTDDISFSRTISANTSSALFDFNLATGVVKLASGQAFDYETGTRVFVITCVADDSFFQSTASVTLSVVDVNEPPTFSAASASISVAEGPAGSVSASLPLTLQDPDGLDATSHTFSVVPGSNYSNYFTFPNPHQLLLTNVLDLDRETDPPTPPVIIIEIAATDQGGETATALVAVVVTDSNDNAPVFDTSSLVMSDVYVGMPAGTSLGTVKATDADEGTNQDIVFSLVTPNAHPGLFSVQANGRVALLRQLTENYGTDMSFGVTATDKGSPSRSTTTVVTLNWNKPPTITNLPAYAAVPQDPTVTKLLITLVTSDPEKDVVTCAVKSVTPTVKGSSSFAVRTIAGGRDLGVYYTGAEELDRTVATSYLVTVTASDGKGGTSDGVLTVEVTPNTPPTSSCVGSDSATVDVSKASVSDVVKAFSISDAENDAILFSVMSTPSSDSFAFDSGSKTVVVARDLRMESSASHEMQIAMSDGANPSLICTLHITLTNMNSPPVFTPHDAVIPVDEHVTALTSLFQFDVTDTGAFTVTWKVDPVNETGVFTFDDAKLQVKLASGQSFDYETKTREFIITCTAHDGYQQSSSSVTISIMDTNDPPYFQATPVQATATEGPAPTVSFLPVYSVVDPDGDTLTYSIVTGGTYANHFSINSATGVMTNQVALERDNGTPNPITVQVKVSDPSGESATANVVVYINDTNDNTPHFDKTSYQFKVGLSSRQGTVVGIVTVTDQDEGTNAQYDLAIASQNPPGYMTLEPDGRLYLTRDLDSEVYGTLFSLRVTATDRGTPARTASAVVDILWNEGPKIHNLPAVAYVHEDIKSRAPIFDLSVTDVESDQYTCVRNEVDPKTDAFDVEDAGNKNFKVYYTGSSSLSAISTREYELTVRCYDFNGEDEKKLSIVVRSNTAPTLTCSPTASVQVDALATAQGDTVYTVQATDAEKDPLEYRITNSVFSIGTYSGTIKAKVSLRSVTTEQYSLEVAVSDPKQTVYCTVVIILTNMNKTPVFSNLDYTVDIPENTAAGSALYVISVTDPNIFGANIGITWTSGYKYKFDLLVSGLTATLRLATGQELDYESTLKTMTVQFLASDGYLTSDEHTLTLVVTPVNETPYFASNVHTFYVTFNEIGSAPQVKSLGCDVRDPDVDDVLTMTLSGENSDLFTIADRDNCQMTMISEYDLDGGVKKSPVTLTLTVKDTQGKTAQATVIVTIEEVNDNDPHFDGPVSLVIPPGTVAGHVIGTVSATDRDSGTSGDVSYSIVTPPLNEAQANQYITFLSTGQFILRQSMDHEFTLSESYQYVIRATDYGSPPRTATTTVDVRYDPYFTTTTPISNTTVALTTEVPADDGALLDEPLVIGLLATLGCLLAVFGAVGIYLVYRYCGRGRCENRPSSTSPVSSSRDYNLRSISPLRSNRISVASVETGYTSIPSTAATAYAIG